MNAMIALVGTFALTALSGSAAIAEEKSGRSLMEEGMQLFFEGLKDEMSPAMRDLRGLAEELGPPVQRFLSEMGPALAEILAEVDDWTLYETPEILPNGDIIIRRRQEEDPDEKAAPEPPSEPTDI